MLIKQSKIKRKQSLPSLKLQSKGYEGIQQTVSFWNHIYITGKYPIRCRDGISLSYYREAKQMAKYYHQQYLDGKVIVNVAKTKAWKRKQQEIKRFLEELSKQSHGPA